MNKKININDYVSFWENEDILYRVLNIHKNYILIKDENDNTYWEKIEYAKRIVKIEKWD